MSALNIGDEAPGFELPGHLGNAISLNNYRGKWVVLAFYPEDTSMVCTKELCSYSSNLSGLKDLDAQILGISTDSIDSHKKFAEKENIEFPLLSDKGGNVSKN